MVYWEVIVWDQDNNQCNSSDVNYFQMGLLHPGGIVKMLFELVVFFLETFFSF